MIIRGHPTDLEIDNYIFVNLDADIKLYHSMGAMPIYEDIENKGIWFRKEDIVKVVDKLGE